jgi:hypothetical protein
MSSLKRPSYFTGRLLSAVDFTADQDYHRDKLRRHNRLVHGHGVARGLTVSIGRSSAGPLVKVLPGCGIDPAGNELELECAVCLAIRLTARAFVVSIALEERFVDPVPAMGGRDTGAGPQYEYASVEESCVVAVQPDDPPGAAHEGLVLARYVRGRGGWRRDPRFRLQRLRR